MNDPGVDEPIGEAAQDIESSPYDSIGKQEREEEQDFLDPSRWWFASTACPLIAGTFGPLANAFSICALVVKWRVYIPPGKDETMGNFTEDPPWLVAVNAVSLGCALIANLSLLLNMARRLPFHIAQPITISGFSLAAFLLIILVSIASSKIFRIQPGDAHALTQAFYYAIIAATLYCLIAMLLLLTVFGAWRKHYAKEFRLTVPQRTLMLQTISFMVYLLLGGLVYSKIEGWNFLDAVYWADYTLLTVGLGSDFPPTTHLGRSLLFPYAFGGIVMVGLVIGSIRSLVLERGKVKLEARMTEVKREKVLSTIDSENCTIRVGFFHRVKFSQSGLSEIEKREQEFNIMRKIQESAEKRRRYTSLGLSIVAAALLWFVGAVVFHASEGSHHGWSYFDALYFSYTSLLTIGYGDYYPASNSGKPFFVFWSLLAVPTLTILISNMGDTVVKSFSDFTIWVGSLTVLPGETGIKTTLKRSLVKLNPATHYKGESSGIHTEKPPGLLPRGGKGDEGKSHPEDKKGYIERMAMDRLTRHIEEEELDEASEANEHGDSLERDTHFYHFVLASELRRVMRDVLESPPKQYTYSEWAYYLKLIGQDEMDPNRHRKAPIKVDRQNHAHPDLGGAGGKVDDEGYLYKWSWLGIRSPLMGSKSEAEWILEKLSATLELELSKMRASKVRTQRQPPPISMADLRKRKLDLGGSSASSGS